MVGSREFLADDMVSDLQTPRLLKHESIYTPCQVVDLNPANSIRGRMGRGDLRSARPKLG